MTDSARRYRDLAQTVAAMQRDLADLRGTVLPRTGPRGGFHQRGKTDQNIGSGSATLVIWQNADYTDDPSGDVTFTAGAGNQFFTIQRPGLYHVATCTRWASNATGVRGVHIRLRASSGAASPVVVASDVTARGVTGAATAFERALVAGNEIDVEAFQSSGGTLALQQSTATWVTVRRIR